MSYMNFRHINSKAVAATSAKAPSDQKTVSLLSGAWEKRYAVASIIIDNIRPPAEVHQGAADIWLVLAGQGKFILGGQLINQKEIKPGEFTGDSIVNGQVERVGPGSIIDIPSGVPHQIDARGSRLELIIVKVRD
ncbi:MAG: hypothetical protein HY506_01305 [Candidatus Yanofskybacteria bacterium]|nr:hypothetical protein [Candidatus Yanofskybacteria bacterium]